MAVLKKYDLEGKEIGEIDIADSLIHVDVNPQLIKDYLVALRANARQWSANTKSRAEVNHSGQKPHPQKGTGRARQGYLGSPQYKGGGRVFGPRPKFDQHVHTNKKERRAAIRYLWADKIKNSKVHVLRYEPMHQPKTKTIAQFLQKCGLAGKRVLFLGEALNEGYGNFLKSIRNVPGLEFMLMPNANGYDVAVSHEIILMEGAVKALNELMGGKA